MSRIRISFAAAAALGLTATAAILFVAKSAGGFLVEGGGSMPRGIYLLAGFEANTGDVVTLPDPPNWRGAPFLLKRVAAASGQTFCWDPERGQHRIDGRWLEPPHPSVPPWEGCELVGNDQLVLLGDYLDSYDSRYFGPVNRTSVGGVYRRVLRFSDQAPTGPGAR